ncbi:DUF4251 domain-containing protein [Desertivirga arenae]|uniref:DUF4251 domain-containing protein n=1 Tax=Desertivirga arenae TaxID=2810309 RepID=UPI001A96C098|nr:DUF4251 domain-containing protein [Pedobacter sp. SYSU D00823]
MKENTVMGTKKYFLAYLLFLLAITINTASAQTKKEIKEKTKAAEIQKLLDSKRFTFKAQTAQPLRGGTINLTSDYELVIKKDSLQSYLPFFGRAFTAPMNPSESPLIFNSTNFNYTAAAGKKGSKNITVELKDQNSNVRRFYLSISGQGYATLQVLNSNRDPISFNGYIAALK